MGKVVDTYSYQDETGTTLYVKKRIEPGRDGRSKEFVFEHQKPNGKWHLGRGQHNKPTLYSLPAIIESDTVYFVEGEGKGKLLHWLGLSATCLDSGARSKWYEEYTEHLKGKSIVILPDNDEPGREYATMIASSLYGKAKEVKIVELPGLKEKEDVVDWYHKNEGAKTDVELKADLLEVAKNTPVWTPQKGDFSFSDSQCIGGCKIEKLKLITIEDIFEYPEPEYLIDSLLEQNTLNILTGAAGIGKSLLSLQMVKSLLTGEPLWGHFEVKKVRTVLVVDEENSRPHLRDRIQKMGFSKGMAVYFYHFQGIKLDREDIFLELMQQIESLKPDFIIFDALIRLHGKDENSNSEMSQVMGQLKTIVGKNNVTVLILHHVKKGNDGTSKDKSRGASDIVAAVDCQLFLETKGDDTVMLSPGKTRGNTFEPILLKFKSTNLSFECVGVGSNAIKTMKDADILNSVVEILRGYEMGVEEIKEKLKSVGGCNVGESRLRRILNDAHDSKILGHKPSGHGKHLYFVPVSQWSASRGENQGRKAG